ncbi:MAG: hypothetical protein JWQ61_2831 [Collimonas fungivorans]|uniref:hypothetical protein n=1 Tax=Collimonas fungivorans TaxID=158899 RepID=UPI0026EF6D8F|nr:hypothetical protein [Collimonas fungivorans]MDB5768017.1 hypothetical protein [Collimonas fungivorans]
MASTLHLGASSLTGKSVNTLVEEAFGKSEFPLDLRLTNHTPRYLVFPDIRAELKPNFSAPDNQIDVTFKDHAQLTRFASDVDSLSELNQWADAMALDALDDAQPEEVAAKAPAAGKGQKKAGAESKSPADMPADDAANTDKK